jgi:hypothetical protein
LKFPLGAVAFLPALHPESSSSFFVWLFFQRPCGRESRQGKLTPQNEKCAQMRGLWQGVQSRAAQSQPPGILSAQEVSALAADSSPTVPPEKPAKSIDRINAAG